MQDLPGNVREMRGNCCRCCCYCCWREEMRNGIRGWKRGGGEEIVEKDGRSLKRRPSLVVPMRRHPNISPCM